MLTFEELTDYIVLDLDENSTDEADKPLIRRLNNLIKVTDEYAKAAISTTYPSDDHRVKEAQLILADDLYTHGEARSDKATARIKEIVSSMLMQVRLELQEVSTSAESTDTASGS
jgi:TATA-box binding protein (TBP) (component of TFIID and TFIIIB)